MIIAFLTALLASGAISLLLMGGYGLYLVMYKGCSIFSKSVVDGACEPSVGFGGALFVVAVAVFFAVLHQSVEVHKRKLQQDGVITKS